MTELRIEDPGATGDYLEVDLIKGQLYVTVCNPWSGNTESGFGREGSILLSHEDAKRLATWLAQWAGASQSR